MDKTNYMTRFSAATKTRIVRCTLAHALVGVREVRSEIEASGSELTVAVVSSKAVDTLVPALAGILTCASIMCDASGTFDMP